MSGSPLGTWPDIIGKLCTLSLCNKVYSGSIDGGTLKEEVIERTGLLRTVNRTSEQASEGDPGNTVHVPVKCAVNGTLYSTESFLDLTAGFQSLPTNLSSVRGLVTNEPIFNACIYSNSFLFNETDMYQLPQFLEGIGAFDNIESNYTINVPSVRHLDPDYVNQSSLTSAKVGWGTSSQLTPLVGIGNVSVASEAALLGSLTDAMTNHIRQNDANKSVALGLTIVSDTFIHISYGWLMLPTVLVLTRGTFLLWTAHVVRKTMYHDMVWRSTQAAVIYHGLDDRNMYGPSVSHEEMKRAQKITIVRLSNEAAGWRLVPVAAPDLKATEAMGTWVLRRRLWRLNR